MNFFFLSYDSPFYWVRAAALESLVAEKLGVKTSAIFKTNEIKRGSVLVINRFSYARLFRLIVRLCRKLGVPYIFDIDDLYWSLPEFSSDDAVTKKAHLDQVDKLAQGASLFTTTNESLAGEILKKYPGKKVVVVPNCTSPRMIPGGGVCIANTDSFKIGSDKIAWFRRLLKKLVDGGVPVLFIGENNNYISGEDDFAFTWVPRVSYSEYLKVISDCNCRYGFAAVEESAYADCKSDVKAQEFLQVGMKVLASDIRPYRELKNEFPALSLELVKNDESSWEKAVDSILAENAPDKDKANCQMQKQCRIRQFRGWVNAAEALKEQVTAAAESGAYRKLECFVKSYQLMQRQLCFLKSLCRPIRGLIRR